jgi:hypothetical protein
VSDGERLRTNFLLGKMMPTLRKVALNLSLDSLMAASGSQMISMVGNALLESASTIISYHCNPKLANVLTLGIIALC